MDFIVSNTQRKAKVSDPIQMKFLKIECIDISHIFLHFHIDYFRSKFIYVLQFALLPLTEKDIMIWYDKRGLLRK